MGQLRDVVVNRLEDQGVERDCIAPLLRRVSALLAVVPRSNLQELNRKIYSLGQNRVSLDDQTLKLVITGLEEEGLIE